MASAAFLSGFASALLDVLFNKVADILTDEAKKVIGCDAAVDELESSIAKAKSLLKKLDASEKKGNIKIVAEKRVDVLFRYFYDAEDLMEDIVALINRSSSSPSRPILKGVLKKMKLTMPRKIVGLQKKMKLVLADLESLEQYISYPEAEQGESSTQDLLNLAFPFYGRESDVKEITHDLISYSSKFDGVSIVGMNGLGKTRLAQTIKTQAADEYSDVLWVDVPRGCFNLDEIIKKLNELQTIQRQSNNSVLCHGDSRVLIIFDNLLELNPDDWCKMVEIINKGINGKIYRNIKFLITTFCSEVVAITSTRSHHLKPLCDDDCEKVIIATLKSMKRDLSESPYLDEVTLNLAKYAGGLPSVARCLGRVLAQYGVAYVRENLRDDLWDSDVFQNLLSPDLKKCYSEIRSHLKQYLVYFSLFPQDYPYPFTADQLIYIWVGEGFIQHSKGLVEIIKIARNHFNQLLGMSVLRLSLETTENKLPTYELNKFSHKLVQLAPSKTYLQLTPDVSATHIHTRHLSLCYNDTCLPEWKKLNEFKVLRTFFALFNSNIGEIPSKAFSELKRLRVLSLGGTDVCKLPESIGCLTSLRYLDISITPKLESVPESLSKLRALHFLKLRKVQGGLHSLPEDFQKLTSMIYIDWDVSDIIHMGGLPIHIGKLSNLQTLPLFPVKNKDGYRISELKNMNDLQGSICITNLENVEDWASSRKAELSAKSFKQVELQWTRSEINAKAKNTLSGLEPTKFLKQLKITNYGGDGFPDWLTNSLLELEEMHLHNCPSVHCLPKHKSVPSLKVLMFEEITNVLKVDHHFFGEGNFPKLELLELTHMENIKEWIMGPEPNVMPQLKVLKFETCPKLTTVSSLLHLSSLEELQILDCGAWESLPDLPVSLNHLIIIDSDLLEKRCQNECDDWQKVDCIKKVEIGGQVIQTSGLKVEIGDQIIQTSGSKRHPLFTSCRSYFFGWKSELLVFLVILFASLLWYQPGAFEKFKL